MRSTRTIGMVIMAAATTQAIGKIVTQAVPYKLGEVEMIGYLAYDDAVNEKRPGVIVVHEWWGLNDFAKEKVRALAELGYVAFAADIYGGGKVATDSNEAGKLAGQFRENPALLRERAKAAYDTLAADPHVDASKIAAIGFCFGGSTVLQMAASGLNLAGVVSFHGALSPIAESDVGRIKAKLLILHGAADTLVPPEAVKAFQNSLAGSNMDWQMIIYSGAKHSFTNPASDKLKAEGVGYNATAARRSWQAMQSFFKEIFGQRD